MRIRRLVVEYVKLKAIEVVGKVKRERNQKRSLVLRGST
jgi:hypothetical protein